MNTGNESEIDFLAGLVELYSDNPDRARWAASLLPREALSVDDCLDIYDAVVGALSEHSRPTMADLVRQPSFASCRCFVVDLVMRSRDCPFGYSLGVDRYAWQINAAYKRRLVVEASQALQSAVLDNLSSAADILEATKAVHDSAMNVQNDARNDTLMDAIDEWAKMEASPVVPTGFWPVDSLCGGGVPVGGMFVIAAPPSVGKSALSLQLVLGALEHDRTLNAVWCLGEMRKEALARRAICHWSTRGTMNPVTMSSAAQRTDLARGAAINMAASVAERLILVNAPLTIQKIEQAVIEKRARILVIDYVQLVELEGSQDRRAEIDGIVKRVRRLSLEHEVAIVVVSNIAKVVSGDTRIGAIGKESSELDFAADILLLGVPDQDEDQHGNKVVRWACKKNRHGACEDIVATFDGRLQTFTDAQASRDKAFDEWGGR